MSYYDTRQTGKIISRLTSDIDTIQYMISGGFVTFLADLFGVVVILGVMFAVNWRLALIAFAVVPLYVLNYKLFIRKIRPIGEELREKWDAMLGTLNEKLSGITVVKAFAREDYETETFVETLRANFKVGMKQMILNRKLSAIATIIRGVGTGGVLWSAET